MPFGFNVFEMLMAKTMWDIKLGNMPFGGGFAGGNFANSCWGNGFPQMNWGDSFNFNGAGASSAGGTTEERIENRITQNKFNTLKGIINDYIKTLKENSEERITVEEKLKACGSYSLEHYEDLKDLYNEYKTKIQTKLKTGVVVSEPTKKATGVVEKALNSTRPNLKTVLNVDSEKHTTAELADGIDAVGLLNSLQTTKKKSYKALYDSAKSSPKTELDKLTKALYSNLSKEAAKLKKETVLSEETKKVLADLSDLTADSATAENVDQMYYWVRKAKAEINNNKYENLQEDFPNDPLLGAANGVEATKKALKQEGLNAAEIEKATVKPDYDNMEPSEAVKSLVENKMLTKLTSAQLASVQKHLPNGVKQAWYDTNSRNNYQTIRFIDENGDLKCLYNIAVVNGAIKNINKNKVTVGEGLSPENIRAVSDKIKELKNSNEYQEVTSASDLDRIFKNTKDKKLYKVNYKGDLVLANGVQKSGAKNTPAAKKSAVDKNAAKYANSLIELDSSTPDVLLNKINKDNIVDVLTAYNNFSQSRQQGIYSRVCCAGAVLNKSKSIVEPVANRIPKALMRKAFELNLSNSPEYKTLGNYFGISGSPADKTFNFTKHDDPEVRSTAISPESRKKVDDMINALLKKVQEKLNS